MILESNAKQFELEFSEMTVALKLPLKNENVSGSTNSTETVNTGTKAKVLAVTGTLPFTKQKHLKRLIQVAEAEDGNGARQIYNISEEIATAADIRQVIFDGELNVRKMKELNAWNVTFSLKQKNSVAEAKEARNNTSKVVSDSAPGTIVSSPTEDQLSDATQTHGMIYNILKKLDAALAPNNENS
jgi:hypothetical protein